MQCCLLASENGYHKIAVKLFLKSLCLECVVFFNWRVLSKNNKAYQVEIWDIKERVIISKDNGEMGEFSSDMECNIL